MVHGCLQDAAPVRVFFREGPRVIEVQGQGGVAVRIRAVGCFVAVGFGEGLDVVAYEDAGVEEGELAVEEGFVVDGVQEPQREACGAHRVECSARSRRGFVRGGFGKGGERAGGDVREKRRDFSEACECGWWIWPIVEREQDSFGDT